MSGWELRPQGWEEVDYKEISLQPFSSNLTDLLKKYTHDVIFVLAGGLNEFAENHQWVIRRLDLALELYKIKPRTIICLGGGTYHKPPPLNKKGFVIHESTACVKYLLDNGVQEEHLMREWSSYDTIANAFFSLVNFAIPMRLKSALVITSDFHMPRTKAIFNWVYGLQQSHKQWLYPTTYTTTLVTETQLEFLSVNSKDLDEKIIVARKVREKQSLEKLQKNIQKIKLLNDFHNWFFTEHKAYNCDFAIHHSKDKEVISDEIKSTY